MIHMALTELQAWGSESHYRVLHARMIDGLPEAEVATATGLTVEQVRNRKDRTQKLAAILAIYCGDSFGKP